MRDERDLITAEDLLEIFSKVTVEFRKRVKQPKPGVKPSNQISKDELLEIFKKCTLK